MELTIGTSIGVFLSGMAVILGSSSVLLLSSKKGALSRQDILLRLYTIILLILGVAFQIQFLHYIGPFITLPFEPVNLRYEILTKSTAALDTTLLLTLTSADGLLVSLIPKYCLVCPRHNLLQGMEVLHGSEGIGAHIVKVE